MEKFLYGKNLHDRAKKEVTCIFNVKLGHSSIKNKEECL